MQMPAVCSAKTLDHATLSHHHFGNCEATTSAAAAAVTQMSMSQDDLKRIAAHRAVDLVESGMVLGLGTGSTAIHALRRIADLLRSGELNGIVGIPTSKKTEGEARALGIPLADLESNPNIDLSIDNAHEILESKGDLGLFCNPKPQMTTPQEFHFVTDDRLGPPLAVTEMFDKVLDEIGVDIASQLSSSPKGKIAGNNYQITMS